MLDWDARRFNVQNRPLHELVYQRSEESERAEEMIHPPGEEPVRLLPAVLEPPNQADDGKLRFESRFESGNLQKEICIPCNPNLKAWPSP